MKSIIQKDKVCLICGSPYVEEHHVFPGNGPRSLSEKYGLKVYLCHEHHQGQRGVHNNRKLRDELQRMAQQKFEMTHTHDEWMSVFHKNYLKETK